MVALVIGMMEVLGLIGGELGLTGGVVAALNDDMGSVGFLVIGAFLLVWAGSAMIWRWKNYEALAKQGADRGT